MTGPHPETKRKLPLIREMLDGGLTHQEIADQMGMERQMVSHFIREYIRVSGPMPPEQLTELRHRWLYVHDIRAMGERAVRETA